MISLSKQSDDGMLIPSEEFKHVCHKNLSTHAHQQLTTSLNAFLKSRSHDIFAKDILAVLPTKELRAQIFPSLLRFLPSSDVSLLQSSVKNALAGGGFGARSSLKIASIPPTDYGYSTLDDHNHGKFDSNQNRQQQRRWMFTLMNRSSRAQAIKKSKSSASMGTRRRSQTLSPQLKKFSSFRDQSFGNTNSKRQNELRPRRVRLQRDKFGTLGFNLRGGAEFGLGIFISKVDSNSPASRSGLRVGDQIISINGKNIDGAGTPFCYFAPLVTAIGLHCLFIGSPLLFQLRHADVVTLFKDANKVKLLVVSVGCFPMKIQIQESFDWAEVSGDSEKIIPGSAQGPLPDTASFIHVQKPELNRVNFPVTPEGIGLSICGGADQGLGIYVSAVSQGGLAQRHGLKAGDQLLDVNGVEMDRLSHRDAIKLLTTSDHLFMTVKRGNFLPRQRHVVDATEWMTVNTSPQRTNSISTASVSSRTTSLSSGSVGQITSSFASQSSLSGRAFRNDAVGHGDVRPHQATVAQNLMAMPKESRLDKVPYDVIVTAKPNIETCSNDIRAESDDVCTEEDEVFGFDFEFHARRRSGTLPASFVATSWPKHDGTERKHIHEQSETDSHEQAFKKTDYIMRGKFEVIDPPSEFLSSAVPSEAATSVQNSGSPSSNVVADDAAAIQLRGGVCVGRTIKGLSTASISSSLSFLDNTVSLAQEWAMRPPSLIEEDENDDSSLIYVTIIKKGKPLGLVLEGGNDDDSTGGLVLIRSMVPGGAFADLSGVHVGDEVCYVNDQSLSGMTHKQAVDTIVRHLQEERRDTIRFGIRRLAASDL